MRRLNAFFKAIAFLCVVCGLVLSAPGGSAAQCNQRSLQKKGVKKLRPYLYDYIIATDFPVADAQPMELAFTVYKDQKYRLVSLTHGFGEEGGVVFKILNAKNEVVFTNEGNPSKQVADFESTSTGSYAIKYLLPEGDRDDAGVGCLSFVLGYK